MQKATDCFYLEEMLTRVTRYIKNQMIAQTQAKLSILDLGPKL